MLLALLSVTLPSADPRLRSAVRFLETHRPRRDGHLPASYLEAHAALALEAVGSAPWRDGDPCEDDWELICNHVVSYRWIDEPLSTESWRPLLRERCAPLVAGAESAAEAATMLNGRIWDAFGVRYSPGMSPAVLAPLDVLESGAASCSGLSLLLAACCRAVGVPARLAGVLDWDGDGGGGGNHVWVEIYSGGVWHFVGAGEPTALNATWFAERLARADGPRVYASSFARQDGDGTLFPLPWRDDAVDDDDAADAEWWPPAIERTEAYR